MAVYDGFFDAVQDDETGEYDRAYSAGDFTGYFAQVIGTGVCVHNNPDSYKLEYEEDGKLFSRMGYLFIKGFWMANVPDEDEDPATYKGYEVALPDNGTYAVVAHLNYGKKMIEIEARTVSQAYPDSLVLGIVNGAAKSAEDTRYNTDLCGIIDTAGALSGKVEWALNYIDNEIESKLAQVEQDIAAQERKLDAKIAEVQAVADSIVPPPVGSIKFSASQNVGDEWLRCDGSFVNERDYPELVAALGKLTPSGDKFRLISDGEIGAQISNMVLYGGKLWVYSHEAKTLYGVDVDGGGLASIPVSSESQAFLSLSSPSPSAPIALSIVPHIGGAGARLFLAQILTSGEPAVPDGNDPYTNFEPFFLIFDAEFAGKETTLSLSPALESVSRDWTATNNYRTVSFQTIYIPYVISRLSGGAETYYCTIGFTAQKTNAAVPDRYKNGYLEWKLGSSEAHIGISDVTFNTSTGDVRTEQRVGFSENNKGESIFVMARNVGENYSYTIYSTLSGRFSGGGTSGYGETIDSQYQRTAALPLAIAGDHAIVYDIQTTGFAAASITSVDYTYCRHSVPLPSAARIFYDPGCYLFGKDIYLIFVGTGILFFREFTADSVGYLDTTSVLGTITQFGQLLHSQDENTLYLIGQDTGNTVKVAKMVLNTLFDYANDGAWLPMIASDGVPAYIKAKETEGGVSGPTVPIQVEITNDYSMQVSVLFNGEKLITGTYVRMASEDGTFSVGLQRDSTLGGEKTLSLNGAKIITSPMSDTVGTVRTENFKTQDYISAGVKLSVE